MGFRMSNPTDIPQIMLNIISSKKIYEELFLMLKFITNIKHFMHIPLRNRCDQGAVKQAFNKRELNSCHVGNWCCIGKYQFTRLLPWHGESRIGKYPTPWHDLDLNSHRSIFVFHKEIPMCIQLITCEQKDVTHYLPSHQSQVTTPT